MKPYSTRTLVLLTMASLALMGLLAGSALADGTVKVYTKLPGVPEGVCVDRNNNLYAGVAYTNELVKLKDDGTYVHVAWIPSKEETGKGMLIGIEADDQGMIYAAYKEHAHGENLMNPRHPDCNLVSIKKSGVYKVDPSTGKVTQVITRGDGWPGCFPDDIDIDHAGNIYVTDLTYSGIWKIKPNGEYEMWCDDPLLNWTDPVLPCGVNVCVLDKEQKNIFSATTTAEGLILRIAIKPDGSAEKPVIHSRGHTYFDGIEIDNDGYIYASEPGVNQIIVVSPKAGFAGLTPRKVIARGAPLEGPTSLVLRNGKLYTANLAWGWPKGAASNTIIEISGFTRD
jgi:sugar lactone lactonase YvrE